MPLFCRHNINAPGLDAYFLNTIAYERATVKKQFFTALTNLSNFKIEHLIKLKDKMIKVQNTGKVFVDETSKTKKLKGTIVSIDDLNASSVESKDEEMIPETNGKVERQVFNVEDLLNRFVKKNCALSKDNDLQFFVKTDMHLPKLLIGNAYALTLQLQQLYNEVMQHFTAGEVTLTTKLTERQNESIRVNFSVILNNPESFSKDVELSFNIADCKPNSDEKDALSLEKPLKILLVEDHEMNQMVATNLLKREFENVEIDLAENGLIAFEKAQQNTFDLILMDINMPVLNGIDATKKIRTELLCRTPILALSAHDFPQQIQQCYSVGMDDFIAKPINIQILKQKIVRALLHSKNKTKQATCRFLACHSKDRNKKIAV